MNLESFEEQQFLNKFEPDGDEFIFRPTPRAPGVRVTPEERDRLIEERKKRHRALVGIIAVAMVLTLIVIFVADEYRLPMPLGTTVTVGVAVLAAIYGTRRNLRLERRALEEFLKDRPTAAPARTKEEARRAHFRQLTWSQIGALAGALIAVSLSAAARYHFLVWENRYWVLGGATLFVSIFALAAYRKWRWGRE